MKMSYFHTLLAEVCTGAAPEVNAKALAWGKQYEDDARTLFEFTTDVQVTESPAASGPPGHVTAPTRGSLTCRRSLASGRTAGHGLQTSSHKAL